ncbi:Hypothetical protein, putative [Bodo saltans]|uniref:Uncharacterized protein n=1 Tax=Bodo saltans TaxID=75058 RepID=A0A0S4J7V1_BODSA|nr:Hypothetical protein, putative [Bodo saltans]|eukprot:CUG86572.1 Hypothetical protein, putative [Bodo saltans]
MLLCDVAIAGLRVLVDHARQGATNLLKVLITWEEEAANDPTGATSNSTNDNRLAIVESYGKGDPVAIATPIVSTFVIAGRV